MSAEDVTAYPLHWPISRPHTPVGRVTRARFHAGGQHLSGDPHCLSCDTWNRVADNMAAIAAHIAAVRGQLRWGCADVRAMLAGFKALPAVPQWWQILEFAQPSENEDEIQGRRRALLLKHHPDKGGNSRRASEINEAADSGMRAAALLRGR